MLSVFRWILFSSLVIAVCSVRDPKLASTAKVTKDSNYVLEHEAVIEKLQLKLSTLESQFYLQRILCIIGFLVSFMCVCRQWLLVGELQEYNELLKALDVQTATDGIQAVKALQCKDTEFDSVSEKLAAAEEEVVKLQKKVASLEQKLAVKSSQQSATLDSQSRLAMMQEPTSKSDPRPVQMHDGDLKFFREKKLTPVKSQKKSAIKVMDSGEKKLQATHSEKEQIEVCFAKANVILANESSSKVAKFAVDSDLSDQDTASDGDNHASEQKKQNIRERMVKQSTESKGQKKRMERRQKDSMSNRFVSLFCGNLRWSAKQCDLKALFERSGYKVDAAVILQTAEGKSRGCGFVKVQFSPATNVLEECVQLSKLKFLGRPIYVEVAKKQH